MRGRQWRAALTALLLGLTALLPRPAVADPDDELQMVLVDCALFGLSSGCTDREYHEGEGTVSIPIDVEISGAWNSDLDWGSSLTGEVDYRIETVGMGETGAPEGATAVEGEDFQAFSEDYSDAFTGVRTRLRQTITVAIINDTVLENDEKFYLKVTVLDTTDFAFGGDVVDYAASTRVLDGPAEILTISANDPAITLTVSRKSITEDADDTPVTVTGTLNPVLLATDTAVTVSVVGDTATVDTDFTAVPDFGLTIRANARSGTATFTFTSIDDQLVEGSETVTVTGTTTGTSRTVQPATLTLTDNDVDSTRVSLAVSLPSVTEDAAATPITVTATLDEAPRTTDTAVTVSVVGDTATKDTDFTAVLDFGLTIRANAHSGTATFTLTPIDDQLVEGSETVTVTGTTTASLIVQPATLTLTDNDVDSTRVSLAVSLPSVTEDAAATPITVTATLDEAPRTEDTAVTVSVVGDTATVDTDFTAVPDFGLTIRANAHSGTATFILTPIDDQHGEGSETVTVTGTTTATSLTVQPATLTLTDNDVASTRVSLAVSLASVTEDAAATPITVTGTLDGAPRTEDTAVTVSVVGDTATVGTDFTAVSDFGLTIRANARSGTATFTLTPIDDQYREGSETVTVTGTATATSLTVEPATLTLADDDVASTRVSLAASPASVTEDAAATPITVTGTLDGAPRTEDTAVTVSVVGDTATVGTDFTAVSDFGLTIRANAHSGTATFTLTPIDDQQVEGSETVTVTGTTTATSLTVTPTRLTLSDDAADGLPPPELSIADVRATEGRHAAAEFSVSLNRATVRTVTVDYATADGSAKAGADYTATRGTLTFAAGERSRTITVALLDDALDEIEETFTVTLSDARHARLADATGTATIRDDSDPMPQAWLARFARTASENVLDAVAARVTAQRFGVPQATLRGRGLDAAWSQSSDADEQARLAALAAWIRSGPEPARVVSGQDLLAGSGFVAPAVAGGALTIWGQGAYGQFQARPGGVEGNVATGMLGLDHAMGPWLMGLAVSHSEGWGKLRASEYLPRGGERLGDRSVLLCALRGVAGTVVGVGARRLRPWRPAPGAARGERSEKGPHAGHGSRGSAGGASGEQRGRVADIHGWAAAAGGVQAARWTAGGHRRREAAATRAARGVRRSVR